MKSENEIKEMLSKIENDERLYYETATVFENAPLAMIQLVGETQSDLLRNILGIDRRNFTALRKERSKVRSLGNKRVRMKM